MPITVRPVGGGGRPDGRTASVRGRAGMVSPAPGCVTRPGLTRGRNAIVSPARSELLGRERPRVPPRTAWKAPLRPNMAGAASPPPGPAVGAPRARTGRGGRGGRAAGPGAELPVLKV